jgi:hypothetical protein
LGGRRERVRLLFVQEWPDFRRIVAVALCEHDDNGV